MKVWDLITDRGYPRYRTAGNERTAFMKVIALIFMVADHCGILFFRGVMEWRVIGRIAYPLYAWCLVVGMGYTRNPVRYSVRLLAMALVSQFFYMRVMNHSIGEGNILVTLLLGQLAIYGMQRKTYGSEYWAPVLAIVFTMLFKIDYGFKGVLLVILLYLAKDSRNAIIGTMIAYCLFWGEGTSLLNSLFGLSLSGLKNLTANTQSLYSAIFRLQNFAVLSLILIVNQIGWKKRHPVWLSYIAYPGHFFILWLVKLLISQ